MKLTITKYLILGIAAYLAQSCGLSAGEQVLEIQMFGVDKAASNASGDHDPNFQNYQLLSVDLIAEDGVALNSLYLEEEPSSLRIVDRPQIIFTTKISELKGNSYAGLQVGFAAEVEGGSKDSDSITFSMPEPTLKLIQAFKVETAIDLDFEIKVNWANTLSSDTMSLPDYSLSKP